jgi:hypothetical protein
VQGRRITAAVRDPSALNCEHLRLAVAGVDVLDAGQVDSVIADADTDAVVSSLGVPFGRHPIDISSRGTGDTVAAMTAHEVRRLVVISSSAADPAARFKNSNGGALLEALNPLVIFVMSRTTHAYGAWSPGALHDLDPVRPHLYRSPSEGAQVLPRGGPEAAPTSG